ncbi:MAG TPA: GtrA family protein [Deltaproteobacteria bacterium]|jgi:putative flippase GtrA|nr:GtrA family protein [Deltaproteobacteria bacterium]
MRTESPQNTSQANDSRRNTLDGLLVGKTDSTLVQLFRYTFVGGFAFLVDFCSLFALTEFAHLHYLVSAAVAFLFGLATNYALSIVWVFNKRSMGSAWFEFLVFSSIGVIGLGLNELLIWFFTARIGFHYLVSKIVSTVAVYCWNFFARKYTLFS